MEYYSTEKCWLPFIQRDSVCKATDWGPAIQSKLDFMSYHLTLLIFHLKILKINTIVQAPEPIESWSPNILDAFEHGYICHQTDRFVTPLWPKSEDCLTLNIYAPGKTH